MREGVKEREREKKQKPLKETEAQQSLLCEKLKARGKLPIDEAFHLFTFSIDFTLEKRAMSGGRERL